MYFRPLHNEISVMLYYQQSILTLITKWKPGQTALFFRLFLFIHITYNNLCTRGSFHLFVPLYINKIKHAELLIVDGRSEQNGRLSKDYNEDYGASHKAYGLLSCILLICIKHILSLQGRIFQSITFRLISTQ